jgi:hypothetical protein
VSRAFSVRLDSRLSEAAAQTGTQSLAANERE